MSNLIGKIRIKNFSELAETPTKETKEITANSTSKNDKLQTTPDKKNPTKQSDKNQKNELQSPAKSLKSKIKPESNNQTRRKSKKETPPNQKRIDSFFKSCSKSYKINLPLETIGKENKKRTYNTRSKVTKKKGKCLFEDSTTSSTSSQSCFQQMTPSPEEKTNMKKKAVKRPEPPKQANTCIDLCSSDDDVFEPNSKSKPKTIKLTKVLQIDSATSLAIIPDLATTSNKASNNSNKRHSVCAGQPVQRKQSKRREPSKADTDTKSLDKPHEIQLRSVTKRKIINLPKESYCHSESKAPPVSVFPLTTDVTPSSSRDPVRLSDDNPVQTRQRKKRPCPPYKVITDTTFAVDAFQFGQIDGVSHYFLTHYHADHYVGLTRKFAMPLYMSAITLRLVRTFIPVEETYLHELSLNDPVVIEGVEVTAIDANHCPGAVMLLFKLSTGKCILHTGDFRACAAMESEPVFWNNHIDTIYLDTTYLSKKYDFCTQVESIDNAKYLVEKFLERNVGKRILFVCGTYLVGKERFWSALAKEFNLKVWAEASRKKALLAMQLTHLKSLFCDDPYQAQMHIVPMNRLNYMSLVEYFAVYECTFDVVLGIRPSGWEKNSKPQMRGKINILGVEYSEHSSYNELQRFVMYIKPHNVISTVPVGGRDLMTTSNVPTNWYTYKNLSAMRRNFQPSITSYLNKGVKISSRSKLEKVESGQEQHHTKDLKNMSFKSCNGISPELDDAVALAATVDKVECIQRFLKFDDDAEDDWLS